MSMLGCEKKEDADQADAVTPVTEDFLTAKYFKSFYAMESYSLVDVIEELNGDGNFYLNPPKTFS
jgi:hypothetical protein